MRQLNTVDERRTGHHSWEI